MTNEIYISVAKEDIRLAEALDTSIESFLGRGIKVIYYKSKKPGCHIPHGEKWFEWILNKTNICDIALVLLTPSSVNNSWIFLESGFIYGVATEKKRPNVFRPITYALNENQIPQLSQIEFRRGEVLEEVTDTFMSILEQYKDILGQEQHDNALKKMDDIVKDHINQVTFALRLKPLIEMGKDEYLTINISDDLERTKKKNEVAKKMGECVRKNGISRQKLSVEDDEVLLLALAQVVHDNPEENDIKLLVNTKGKVRLKHIRFMILYSIELLNHKSYIKKEDVPDIEEMLADFSKGEMDDNLEWRIKATERIINVIKSS